MGEKSHSYLDVLQFKLMTSKLGLPSPLKIHNLSLCHALHLLCYQPHSLAQSLPQRAATPHPKATLIKPHIKIQPSRLLSKCARGLKVYAYISNVIAEVTPQKHVR